ncbi:MAG: hypothetical protein IJL87_05630, partial [Clostridia bacterium]|nr:hypothetical protein [Clostridia bacterium]
MKKTRFAAILMAMVMLVMSIGLSVSAADGQSASGQSTLTNVQLNNGVITGHFNSFGWLNNITAYAGNGTSGTQVGVFTPATWSMEGDFSINLSDGGAGTNGYTVYMTNTSGNEAVTVYIPYTGPSYLMKFQRNGSDISAVTLGLNEGTASGFSFVYESGGSYTYTVSNNSIITVNKSGDNFTITPKAVGTATITATCNGTTSADLVVTVTDDSTLSAQWYDTGATITNGASFSGQATVVYGFGVEAYPDNYNVTLSNNTANATYASSTVAGQYPNTIVAANEGSVTVNIAGQTKTISFTVNFSAAPEPVFGFFTDSSCQTEAEPLVAVQKNASVTIYTNENVANWNVSGNGITYTTTATSITITGVTVDSITTITARDSSNNTLGWFDAYVTTADEPDPDPDPIDAFVFKVGYTTAYWMTYDYSFEVEVPCQYVGGATYVPFRVIAQAAGAKSVTYNQNEATVTLVNSSDMTFILNIDSTECTVIYGGQSQPASINSAP